MIEERRTLDHPCTSCNGVGYIVERAYRGASQREFTYERPCDRCQGTGRDGEEQDRTS